MRVYLSSTFEDLESHRRAVAAALREASFTVVSMETYSADARPPLEKCLSDIEHDTDVLVGLLAHKYGSVPAGTARSFVEHEYRKAGACGIPCLMFLLDGKHSWSAEYYEVGPNREKLDQLKAEIQSLRTTRLFTTPDDLAAKAVAAVSSWSARSLETDDSHVPRLEVAAAHGLTLSNRFHFTADAFGLLGRDAELHELDRFLLPSPDRTPDVRWWVWTGPGGVGKSRLALELCRRAANGPANYRAGFLREISEQEYTGWSVRRPTLVVLDYVAGRARDVGRMIAHFAARWTPDKVRAPLRFLLLERSIDTEGDKYWRDDLFGRGTQRQLLLDARTDPSLDTNHRVLSGLSDEATWAFFESVWASRMAAMPDKALALEVFRQVDPATRPLFAALAAEAVARAGHLDSIRNWSQTDLTRHVLDDEFRRWLEFGMDEDHLNLLTFTTMTGSPPKAALACLRAGGFPVPASLRLDWFHHAAGFSGGAHGDVLPGLVPDILGELFVLERLAGNYTTVRDGGEKGRADSVGILGAAWRVMPPHTAVSSARALFDFPDHRSVPVLQSPPDTAGRLPAPPDWAFADAYIGLALACGWRGHSDKAVDLYTRVLALPGANSDQRARALLNRGYRNGVLGRSEAALADYTAAIDVPGVPLAEKALPYLNRAGRLTLCMKDDDALADCTFLIESPEFAPRDRAKAHALRGQIHMRHHRLEAAAADYRAAVEAGDYSSKEKANLVRELSKCYFELGRHAEDSAFLTAALESDWLSGDDVAPLLFRRLACSTELRDESSAARDFHALFYAAPRVSADQLCSAVLHYAGFLEDRQRYAEAIQCLDDATAAAHASDDVRAVCWLMRGSILTRRNELPEAAEAFRRSSALPATWVIRATALYRSGKLAMTSGDHRGAAEQFTGMIDAAATPLATAHALALRGMNFGRADEYGAAAADFEKLLTLGRLPNSLRRNAHYNLGVALRVPETADAALEHFDRFFSLAAAADDPDLELVDTPTAARMPKMSGYFSLLLNAETLDRTEYLARLQRGRLLVWKRRFEDAIADLTYVIEAGEGATPDYSEAFYFRAKAFGELRRTHEELADLGRFLASDRVAPPLRLEALMRRASILDTLGRHREELGDYDAILALPSVPDATRGWALFRRGATLGNFGEDQPSEHDYRAALAIESLDVDVRGRVMLNLSTICFHSRRRDEGVRLCKAALALGALAADVRGELRYRVVGSEAGRSFAAVVAELNDLVRHDKYLPETRARSLLLLVSTVARWAARPAAEKGAKFDKAVADAYDRFRKNQLLLQMVCPLHQIDSMAEFLRRLR